MTGPTCATCDAAYPDPAAHESCADIRVHCEGNGWAYDGKPL